MAIDYQRGLEEAEEEIEALLAERERIDKKINLLKDLVASYASLLGASRSKLAPVVDLMAELKKSLAEMEGKAHLRDAGISNAIRQVLSASKVPLSVSEIKSALESNGVELKGYANAGAVIHNTLGRLAKQGELISVRNPAGQTVAYALVSKNALRDRVLGIQPEENKE